MAKRGRPTIYTDQLAEKICKRIEAGESVRSICKDPDMPERTTVAAWVRNNEVFSNHYAKAKEAEADDAFDEIEEIAAKAEQSPELTQALKLIVDTRKWVLSKKLPKKYGDKTSIEHSGGVTFSAPKALDD